MERNGSKYLWVGLAVALIIGTLWQFYPLPDAKKRLEALPLTSSSFTGHDVALSRTEQKFLRGVNNLKRMYNVEGVNLFITAIDGTHNRHVVHDPLYCFQGGGWKVLHQAPFPMEKGEAKLVKIVKGDKTKNILFWFSDGTHHYASTMRYWWQATLRRLSLGVSGPEPILIVIQSIGVNEIDWTKTLNHIQPILNL